MHSCPYCGCPGVYLADTDGGGRTVACPASGKPASAPRAEGCEALIEHDAPQTPAELYDKIIASNPATYGRPRKPTGEELAEMAEEETNV